MSYHSLFLKKASFTLSKDGTGANCAIVGSGATSLYNGYEIVSLVTGKILVPLYAVCHYVYGGAAYTGGGNITVTYNGNVTALSSISAANSFGGISNKNYVAIVAGSTIDWPISKWITVQCATAFTDDSGLATGTGVFTVYYYEITP